MGEWERGRFLVGLESLVKLFVSLLVSNRSCSPMGLLVALCSMSGITFTSSS